MKDVGLSLHIWRAIEAQAKAVADNLDVDGLNKIGKENVESVNEFELKRLRILIRQLEEESPN
ncbi:MULTISPECIES: hypothetical protein [unclassified Vibrio]|uniref:hypothetical protein n=1 Tax=unclassified Vibrio TaxID=2614977 RepID=UPI000B8E46BD|nr:MULTISPECIES: hypothetical protein [unclassified Vibrio]NAX44831.1 hypothetical protein [Vibrio sp. V25_P4S6T154]OXX40914.1 hypothetical protein B9J93_21025 [Vibrio sp. V17_P4S1T151]OXX59168.1 hypothetical protein B9J89_19485 [Vibrio sp. V15_P4S5T153]OXX65408.1 hypothetical protein B9J94_15375 [Vibrio sp. V20_P4S3T152]